MKKLFRLTKEGVDELTEELDTLTSKRGEIADSIKNVP